MAKNLTPAHLRCPMGDCPSVHELEDGRLLIVGKDGHAESIKLGIHGAMDERAIIIDRELLSGLDRWLRTGEESKSGVDVAEEAKGGF